MKQVLDWLNENELRAYPLIDTPERLANLHDNFLLDLQLRTHLSLYSAENGSVPVYLKSVASGNADELIVVFGTLTDNIAVFVIENPSAQVYPKYIRNEDGNLAVFGAGAANFNVGTLSGEQTLSSDTAIDIANWKEPLTLLTGANTITLFSSSEEPTDFNCNVFGQGTLLILDHVTYCHYPVSSIVVLNIQIEPATCTEFSGAWLGVTSLAVSPEKVTEDFSGEVCIPEPYAPKLPLSNKLTPSRLAGDIKLLEGYNFRVSTAENTIDLEVGQDYGLRMSCCTSFMPPEYLDCGELVSYINGVPPDADGNFRLNPGSNIDITGGSVLTPFYDPVSENSQSETANTHTLFVGLSFKSSELCSPINIPPL
jgi:hypothetical protein